MLEFLGPLVLLLALLIPGTDRRLVRRLRGAHAVSPAEAMTLEPRFPVAWWRLRRLASVGAVRPATSGRWYLDEGALLAWRRVRRRRMLIALGVLATLLLLVALGAPAVR